MDPTTSRDRSGRAAPELTPEQAIARVYALQGLTLDLAVARTAAEVSDAIAQHALGAVRAAGSVVWYLDGRQATVQGAAAGRLADVALDAPDLAAFAHAERPHAEPPGWLTEGLAAALGGPAGDRLRTATLRAGGAVVGALAVVRDAPGDHDDPELLNTIMRPAGEALGRARRDAEALQLATLVESSDDAVLGVDPDMRIRTWNPAAERIFGYSPEEALGRHAMFLSPGGVPDPAVVEALQRMLAGGGGERLETDHRRPDGVRIVAALTLSPVRDARGTLIGIAGVARDITAQREAEWRLRRFAAVVEASPDAVVMIAPDGKFIDCNPAAERWDPLESTCRHASLSIL